METSIIENKRSVQEIFHNFRVTKNIPLDNRLIVEKLSNIDNELPVKQRYDGMIIFIEDVVINNQTGQLFYFGKDLLTPLPLAQSILGVSIKQLILTENVYGNLINSLNNTSSVSGSIVTILPLDIAFIYDGTNWKYFVGVYKVSTEEIYNTIPDSLKEINKFVWINDGINIIEKQIQEDLFLKIPEKFNIITITLMKGKNRINHLFDSTYVFCFMRIYDILNPEENNNEITSIPIIIIDEMNFDIESSFDNLTVDLLIKTNKIN
jgi:hypothetical protein